MILVQSTINVTCFWGGKTCAKWTNQLVKQQGCDDPELGSIRAGEHSDSTAQFCRYDMPNMAWILLGERYGKTKLITRERRKIW